MRTKWTNILIPSLVILLPFLGNMAAYWYIQLYAVWGSFLIICAVISAIYVSKKLHWSFGLAYFYSLVSSLFVCATLYHFYTGKEDSIQLAIQKISSMAGFTLCLMTTAFVSLKNKYLKNIEHGLAWLCLINSFVTAFELLGDKGGLTGNPSLNGALLALTYPLLNFRKEKLLDPGWKIWAFIFKMICYVLPVIAIIRAKEISPALTMGVVGLSYFFARYKFSFKAFKVAMLACTPPGLAFLAYGYHLDGFRFFSTNGRGYIWKIAYDYFIEKGSLLFGFGLGTTSIVIPAAQTEDYIKNQIATGGKFLDQRMDIFLFLHSDILQTGFEQGLIGLVLWGIALGFILKGASRSIYLFPAICGWLACASIGWPLHAPIHALAGLVFAIMALKGLKDEHSTQSQDY